MLRRNGPVVKCVESVLRLEGSLWWERLFCQRGRKEVGATTVSGTLLAETTSDNNNVNGDHQQQTESASSSSEAADVTSTHSSTFCDVCLVARRHDVVLVPRCGYSRFCAACAHTVAEMSTGCPVCMSVDNPRGHARVQLITLIDSETHLKRRYIKLQAFVVFSTFCNFFSS